MLGCDLKFQVSLLQIKTLSHCSGGDHVASKLVDLLYSFKIWL